MRGYELLELWKAEHLFLQQIDALDCQDRLRVWLCQDQATGTVSDLPRVGCPRLTTWQQNRYVTLTHLQSRFQLATVTASTIPGLRKISSGTICINCLHEQGQVPCCLPCSPASPPWCPSCPGQTPPVLEECPVGQSTVLRWVKIHLLWADGCQKVYLI